LSLLHPAAEGQAAVVNELEQLRETEYGAVLGVQKRVSQRRLVPESLARLEATLPADARAATTGVRR